MKIKALKCTQNDKVFYSAILKSSELKEKCYISRRDEDSKGGFQRSLNEARAKDIAKYLDVQKGVIPSALILSSQEKELFYDESKYELDLNDTKFLVLDGQHRLYGLQKSERNYEFPVVIFENLSLEQEVSLFIDINTTQKGVPQALLLDIKHIANRETPLEERQNRLLNDLDKESVMMGKFSKTGSKRGKISRIAFNQSTKYIFEESIYKEKSSKYIYNVIKNYLRASDYVLEEAKSLNANLTRQVIFKAMMNIFEKITEECLKKTGNLKVEALIDLMEFVSRVNFDNYSGSDNKTLTLLTSELRDEFNRGKNNLLENEDIF